MSDSSQGSAKDGRTRSRGSAASAGSAGSIQLFQRNVCTFWLGERCFALDVALVGEVVSVESAVAIPLCPPTIRGLFNLRGTPVPWIDLGALVESSAEGGPVSGAPERRGVALVVKSDELLVGLAVDRLDGVVSAGRGAFVPRAADEHPVVQGFLELPDEGQPVVTVLEPRALLERLRAMKFVQV